ncbi:MAG: UDP-N-acetylmuramoyl-L-alanine--D-glutamate ligase [Anaeromyxobacter sp.]|nr:UDP-N-acetylmuramoyl-L-alanine--D-glutamate ligase [Anaeromyxobacter sp.]MBL0275650.1 UDP-N-acetylmuramoyl-L-alanine--D-glutamate ligase [Anaeromyxobacter sp.]
MTRPPELKGKRVTVLGLARSGVAAARLLLREGALVTVTDARPAATLAPALAELGGAAVRAVLGGHDERDFTSADLVVVSPGVPLWLPHLRTARQAGVPVWGEVELAYRFLQGVPLVAITGTNGKSTTTALAAALFAEDRATFAGGNLGTPLCQHVLSGQRADVVVAELSSFQLEAIERLRPKVAAILNVTPDHLDRYQGLEAYAAAKARLFETQQAGDFAVTNLRDERAVAMAGASRGAVYTFGFGPPARAAARAPAEGDGTGPGEIWFYRYAAGSPERYRLANRALRGRHNRENAMAALLCARLLGVPGSAVQRGLDAFGGLPNRLELVRERGGVEWINDSKATNVDSTAVGLAAFPAGAPRVVLVMGGRGKKAPYAPLRPLFAGRVKALLTLGEDAPAVERELGDAAPTEACGTLAQAVARAAALATPGDVVLLSPACASYDQFSDFEARGAAFRQLVEALP